METINKNYFAYFKQKIITEHFEKIITYIINFYDCLYYQKYLFIINNIIIIMNDTTIKYIIVINVNFLIKIGVFN